MSGLQAHMGEIYLIYAFAFLFLGMAIFLQPRMGNHPLERHLWLLALFGLLHAGREFAEWWHFVYAAAGTALTEALSTALLLASFVTLVEFGRRLCRMLSARPAPPAFAWRDVLLYAVLCCGVLVVTLAASDPLRGFTAGARYFFGFPGALLAGIGLFRFQRAIRAEESPVLFAPLRLTMAGFLIYGLFAGLVIAADPALPAWLPTREGFLAVFGFPVELLRALCAVFITVGISRVLHRLNVDTRTREQSALKLVQCVLLPVARARH